MTTSGPQPIAIADAIASLLFLPDRAPTTTVEQSEGAFRRLANYRDGGIFVGQWGGSSEWERHPAGDEIVIVIGGRTTVTFLADGDELSAALGPNELVVVPRGTWHRFETPDSVTLFSVTPEPTDHTTNRPS
jgi:mannose-6-phosphate isomerase-like protein (cupin superfamily)